MRRFLEPPALQTPAESEQAAGSFDEIERASLRARKVIRRILQFSRGEAPERQPIDIKALIDETLAMLKPRFSAQIEVRVNCAPDLPTLLADATQIHQVLLNLSVNASHAMQAGPGTFKIDIDTTRVPTDADHVPVELTPGLYICITVSDSGTGMSRETVARAFEPYFTTMGSDGTGLGLSVVHGIVREHGGAITLDSEVGKGTSFRVYLPAAPAAGSQDDGVDGADASITHRVMYVDNDEALMYVMVRMCRRYGIELVGFNRPDAAIQALRDDPYGFDYVVTDMNMPEMSGLELARALREISPEIGIALSSGWDYEQDAKAAGIEAVLDKSGSIIDTTKSLQGLLRKQMH